MGCLAEVSFCYRLSHNSNYTWFLANWKHASLQLRQALYKLSRNQLCALLLSLRSVWYYSQEHSDLYQIYSLQSTTESNKYFAMKYTCLMLSLFSLLYKQQLICSSTTLHWLCSRIKHLSSPRLYNSHLVS